MAEPGLEHMNTRFRFAAPFLREDLLVFCFYFAMALIMVAPLSLSPATRAANEGDPLHISWILAWVTHQLTSNPLQLFESNAFYPYPSSLAFSEHLTAQAVMASPIYVIVRVQAVETVHPGRGSPKFCGSPQPEAARPTIGIADCSVRVIGAVEDLAIRAKKSVSKFPGRLGIYRE